MATRRTYNQRCAVAHALDLVGERWALLIVRELLLGPKRFTDLRAGLPQASPNVLSQRLQELEQVGVLWRHKLPPPAGSRVYELTDWGSELKSVVAALARWGVRSPLLDPNGELSVDSIMLGLRTFFDPNNCGADWSASYELRFGEDRFSARIAGGQLEVQRGQAVEPDVLIETDAPTFAALLDKSQHLAAATRTGQMKLAGGADLVERLLQAVSIPPPVPFPGQ